MLKKVVYVALLVSDQDKTLDFYTNVIGLEKRGDYPTPDGGPRFLTVGVKGQDFELVLWPGTPARAKQGSAVYTIEVENCRMAFETLKSRGVLHRLKSPPLMPTSRRTEHSAKRTELTDPGNRARRFGVALSERYCASFVADIGGRGA
jgi:catechol 2,3-dioxygenase-like lactoylglutathione lyase family enzyme